jgi:hypothetical protein
MPSFTRAAGFAVCALTSDRPPAFGQRAFTADLSDPERQAVPDAMREIRTPEYSRGLLNIALSNDSPGIREWQLLSVSGTYRVQESE